MAAIDLQLMWQAWEHSKAWLEIGAGVAGIVVTGVAAVIAAPEVTAGLAIAGTALFVFGVVAGVVDTVEACAKGERLSCGAGIVGLATAGAGRLVDKTVERLIEETGKSGLVSGNGFTRTLKGTAVGVSNPLNTGGIVATAVGAWGDDPSKHGEH
jgi:hypothetical protein